ncbi:export protein FliQ [Grimontia sp. AD028]|uniref:Flagellar biosynthetic protein FliQ n=1 Tax=Grimontia celer TaxID=1796497 RepID=A0A128F845_9GAMM|nr:MULTISPECIES: flagellar biosynthetic protein FliQ [Grimontia]KKD62274.1 export protein FliQ [Grimontia sp. AD028]CZF82675.1 Flagellar biosynthetic protein FliQ [Grimontia celer]
MDKDAASFLLSEMMSTAFLVCGPVLLVALVVGLAVSIIQVVTQIQEMTLTFVPKMFAVALIIMLMSGWMLGVLTEFTISLFEYASSL